MGVRWLVGLIVLGLLETTAQEYNLRRLFRSDEVVFYDVSVEASLAEHGRELQFDKAQYSASVRLKTAGIREGIATQYLNFVSIGPVVAEAVTGLPAQKLPQIIVGAKVQNAGVISWDLSAGTRKGPLPWHAQGFVPTEWFPPMPDRLVPIAGTYSGELIFALAGFLPQSGWPQEVRVPATLTFLGSTGPRDALQFRVSREASVPIELVSSDGAGKVKGKLVASGSWNLDAATGRLVKCDLSWLVRLEVSAPAALGGARVIDAVLHTKAEQVVVGSLRDR